MLALLAMNVHPVMQYNFINRYSFSEKTELHGITSQKTTDLWVILVS